MTKRKFLAEIAVTLPSQGTLLMHPKDISNLDQQSSEIRSLAEDCHIYVIAKRPRLHFVPDSLVAEKGNTRGKLTFSSNGTVHEVNFTMEGEPAYEIQYAPYPHRTIDLMKDGVVHWTLPAHLMPASFNWTDTPSVRDLEVVYVGMAYGDSGSRSAKDRLNGHSTLQQVLADLNAEEPEVEALIIMVQYAPPLSIIHFDGRNKTLSIEDDRDPFDSMEMAEKLLNRKLETALAEAGLIRYFQPKYNEKYKNTFPSRAQSITEALYTIDLLGFAVEINTQDIGIRLFSENRNPGYHHIASFDLHEPKERQSFFNILESSSSYRAENFSGPLF